MSDNLTSLMLRDKFLAMNLSTAPTTNPGSGKVWLRPDNSLGVGNYTPIDLSSKYDKTGGNLTGNVNVLNPTTFSASLGKIDTWTDRVGLQLKTSTLTANMFLFSGGTTVVDVPGGFYVRDITSSQQHFWSTTGNLFVGRGTHGVTLTDAGAYGIGYPKIGITTATTNTTIDFGGISTTGFGVSLISDQSATLIGPYAVTARTGGMFQVKTVDDSAWMPVKASMYTSTVASGDNLNLQSAGNNTWWLTVESDRFSIGNRTTSSRRLDLFNDGGVQVFQNFYAVGSVNGAELKAQSPYYSWANVRQRFDNSGVFILDYNGSTRLYSDSNNLGLVGQNSSMVFGDYTLTSAIPGQMKFGFLDPYWVANRFAIRSSSNVDIFTVDNSGVVTTNSTLNTPQLAIRHPSYPEFQFWAGATPMYSVYAPTASPLSIYDYAASQNAFSISSSALTLPVLYQTIRFSAPASSMDLSAGAIIAKVTGANPYPSFVIDGGAYCSTKGFFAVTQYGPLHNFNSLDGSATFASVSATGLVVNGGSGTNPFVVNSSLGNSAVYYNNTAGSGNMYFGFQSNGVTKWLQGWQRSDDAMVWYNAGAAAIVATLSQAGDFTLTNNGRWTTATGQRTSQVYRASLSAWQTTLIEQSSATGPMIGFLGASPVLRQTLPAAATDAATTQTLANSLRTALINLGLAA